MFRAEYEGVDPLKVGIPRALLYYYYYPLWKTFFEGLGYEVVVSRQTSKELVDRGIKLSVPEICVPIKIFNGHIMDLVEKNVDYIYVPRMMHIREKECFCPKFMGLPDMVRYSLPGTADKLLFPQIKAKSDDIANNKSCSSVGGMLCKRGGSVKEAIRAASNEWNKFRNISRLGYGALEAINLWESGEPACPKKKHGGIKIGLIGYVYDIYDEFVSMNIMNKLYNMDVDVVTFEMCDEKELDTRLKGMKKRLFWTFSNKLLGAGYKFLDDPSIEGIVHVTAFGCGPDSLLGKLMELESIKYRKPFMTVRVDEHTGENHLLTRFEAFIDMLKRKRNVKRREA